MEKAGGFRVPFVAGLVPPEVWGRDVTSPQPPCWSTGSDELVLRSQLGWTVPEEEVTRGFWYAICSPGKKTSCLTSQAGWKKNSLPLQAEPSNMGECESLNTSRTEEFARLFPPSCFPQTQLKAVGPISGHKADGREIQYYHKITPRQLTCLFLLNSVLAVGGIY